MTAFRRGAKKIWKHWSPLVFRPLPPRFQQSKPRWKARKFPPEDNFTLFGWDTERLWKFPSWHQHPVSTQAPIIFARERVCTGKSLRGFSRGFNRPAAASPPLPLAKVGTPKRETGNAGLSFWQARLVSMVPTSPLPESQRSVLSYSTQLKSIVGTVQQRVIQTNGFGIYWSKRRNS